MVAAAGGNSKVAKMLLAAANPNTVVFGIVRLWQSGETKVMLK